jgi:hypothetical protein
MLDSMALRCQGKLSERIVALELLGDPASRRCLAGRLVSAQRISSGVTATRRFGFLVLGITPRRPG